MIDLAQIEAQNAKYPACALHNIRGVDLNCAECHAVALAITLDSARDIRALLEVVREARTLLAEAHPRSEHYDEQIAWSARRVAWLAQFGPHKENV